MNKVKITARFRSGNKECPTCRKKLVSKRSLRYSTTLPCAALLCSALPCPAALTCNFCRPDPNFDMLVSKIFPDREEYEEQQEKVETERFS